MKNEFNFNINKLRGVGKISENHFQAIDEYGNLIDFKRQVEGWEVRLYIYLNNRVMAHLDANLGRNLFNRLMEVYYLNQDEKELADKKFWGFLTNPI